MDDLDALADQIPDEVLDYVDDLESQVADLTGQVGELTKRLETQSKPSDDGDGDPIAKALSELPADAAALFKSQQDRLAAAEEALAAERIAKADSVWIAKARSFDGLIDNPEEFGPVLRKVADIDTDLADQLEGAFRTATSRIEKSGLFSEIGHGQSDSSEVMDRIDAIAKSYAEANADLSPEAARALVWENNPDLYTQYVAEQRRKVLGG